MIKKMAASPTSVPPDPIKGRPQPAAERPVSERNTTELDRGLASTRADTPVAEEPPTPARGTWTWLVVLLVMAVVGWAGWHYQSLWWPRVAPYFIEAKAATKPERIVPVVTAAARKHDMKIYLNGLGTVTALKTVTIRSRVEGELIDVNFVEGQMVREGDLLAEIDRRPFEVQRDQAAGQLARDEATLKAAKLTLDRLERLARQDTVSTQDVENQLAIVQQTEGTIRTDKAMVANAELQLTYCRILSPIDGRIGLRLVDIGNIVRANDPSGLAVINQLTPIAVVFTISQDDIKQIRKQMGDGQPLPVEAYDRDFTNKLASGKLMATDNQVDSSTGTLRLKAVIDQNAEALFPNQFVNTRLLVETREQALVVPSAAVQRGPNGTFVYVVKPDSTVELRKVVTGPSEGNETLIEPLMHEGEETIGLEENEVVVTEGVDKLQPKAKVAPRAAKAKGGDSKKSGAPESARPGQSPADKPQTVVPPAEKPTSGVDGAKADR